MTLNNRTYVLLCVLGLGWVVAVGWRYWAHKAQGARAQGAKYRGARGHKAQGAERRAQSTGAQGTKLDGVVMEVNIRVGVVEDVGSVIGGDSFAVDRMGSGIGRSSLCPRCGNVSFEKLEKYEELANTCYRCRSCGHIFSPRN